MDSARLARIRRFGGRHVTDQGHKVADRQNRPLAITTTMVSPRRCKNRLPTPRKKVFVLLLLLLLSLCASTAAAQDSFSVSMDGELAMTTTRHQQQQARASDGSSSLSLPIASNNDTIPDSAAAADKPPKHHPDCGIWLAPSTIPGAGLGLYAGRDFYADEQLQAQGDLALSIIDLRHHMQHDHDAGSFKSFLWDEYTWNAQALNMDHDGLHDVNAASMGFGAAANCFLPLLNVDEYNPTHVNPQHLHRSRDPGAGAVSSYGNRTTTASRDVVAGEEFFVSYGENWFITRPSLGPIPLTDDFDHATRLVEQYKDLYTHQSLKLSSDTLDSIWDVFVRNTSFVDSRVIGAFHHDDASELEQLLHHNKTIAQLRSEQSTRSTAWLQEHGTCGDHITAKMSTLPQAGMGAFSTRFLPRHTRVAAMPLIHVPDRAIFNMYHFDPESAYPDKRIPKPEFGIRTRQLLLNYCFGHEESTLLLCPYGPMSGYINHNQTRANLQIVWADAARGNHMPRLLRQDLESLTQDATAKLAFDVVALRDIEPDEELFLDYGDDWEAAWQHHVATWKPVPAADRYRPAVELNADKLSRVPTEFEILSDPSLNRPDVELWCNNIFGDSTWREYKRNGTLDDFIRDSNGKIYRCDNLGVRQDEEDGSWLYSVVLWYEDKAEGRPVEYIDDMEDVPAEAFYWYDQPYSSDVFLSNAFRHAMGVPDNMFPHMWRNLQASPPQNGHRERQE